MSSKWKLLSEGDRRRQKPPKAGVGRSRVTASRYVRVMIFEVISLSFLSAVNKVSPIGRLKVESVKRERARALDSLEVATTGRGNIYISERTTIEMEDPVIPLSLNPRERRSANAVVSSLRTTYRNLDYANTTSRLAVPFLHVFVSTVHNFVS